MVAMIAETVVSDSAASMSVSTVSLGEVSSERPSSSDGISVSLSSSSQDYKSDKGSDTKSAGEFTSLKNAIKLMNLEAIKAEEVYKAENLLLSKANDQLMKFSRLLQEQDAELAATEEALNKERKQRESAEKHFIKLKKMMVVKDVEVCEAEQRKKSEVGLRKGAEKEMTMLRRQLQTKENQLAASEKKYQKECKKREKLESQMMEISKKAGRQSAEEKYQMLERLREQDVEVNTIQSLPSNYDGSKENSFAATNSYEQWKKKEAEDTLVASLMTQLGDVKDQLNQTEEDLKKANERFLREKQIREESDRQLIVMREKGFSHNIDRRTSARTHAEDCLNTERLKLRNADLQEQYDILKAEAKKTLEKARDRVNEEKASREAMEEQMAANRRHFEDALNTEKEEHKKNMEDLAQKVKQAQEEIAIARTCGTEKEIEDLRQKNAEYQQQLTEAKDDCKKERAMREELQREMQAMENELDSMEAELKRTRETLEKVEGKHQEVEQRESALAKLEKTIKELRAAAAETSSTHLEAAEKIKMLEEELHEAQSRCKLLKERHHEEQQTKERLGEETQKKVHALRAELKSVDTRCKLLKEKLQKEQETKEKSEEAAFKLTQSVRHLTAELNEAKSKRQEAEKESASLRKKVESITSNFQNAMSQGENAEQRLQNQVSRLTRQLEETKQSLEEANNKYFLERDLRQAAEAGMSIDDRSLLRRNREETEQERINIEANMQALHLSEEKWRTEKQQREMVEEQCRELREEIHNLKHEQIMSSHHPSHHTDVVRDDELEGRIAKLKEELVLAESRRLVSKETLEEERRRREELEQQNQTFRDMIPEYAEAEERYQKERRLRVEAESTIETLRSKMMDNKLRDTTVTQNESTLPTVDNHTHRELQRHVTDLQGELESVRSKCEQAQAALHVAHERYEQEHSIRSDVENQLKSVRGDNKATHSRASSVASYDVDRKLREKAEKQVMSMRLKMEAKETEIASLKSRLSATSSDSSHEQRRRSGASVEEMSPRPPTGRQLEYQSSYKTNWSFDDQQSEQIKAEEEQHLREQVLGTLPEYVKNNFGRIGFVKHSSFDYWPALVLDPFTVPLSIRMKWLELYYEFDKRDMFLVYLYGRRHRESVNAYPIVEPHHFIAYEDGVERNLDQLPQLIEDKLRYGDQMTDIEEELSDGLTQIRIDARQHPRNRTHPLDENRSARHDTVSNNPSMTSSTSNVTNLSYRTIDERLHASPRRPRSEYSK